VSRQAWVLDIETIPEGLEPGERIEVPQRYRVPYTSPKFGAFAAATEAARAQADHDQKCLDLYLRTALHPRRCQIVAWAAMPLQGGPVEHYVGPDEGLLLNSLEDWLAGCRRDVRILAWNGPGFDFPVIRARALVHDRPKLAGVFAPRAWQGRVFGSSDTLVDLMPFAPESVRGYASKKDVAASWGVDISTHDGSEVATLWSHDRLDAIRDHVVEDVEVERRLAEIFRVGEILGVEW